MNEHNYPITKKFAKNLFFFWILCLQINFLNVFFSVEAREKYQTKRQKNFVRMFNKNEHTDKSNAKNASAYHQLSFNQRRGVKRPTPELCIRIQNLTAECREIKH